jgi:endonuclease/exonuclease/phosphatase family metal-dependent hydrolase
MEAENPAFTVITINTWKGEGAYQRRLELLAGQLARLNPDIIACQEVLHTDDEAFHTGRQLAAHLQMHLTCCPARRKERLVAGQRRMSSSGLAILSRRKPLESIRLTLPEDPRDGERVAQICRLPAGANQLLLVNTHLSHLAGADDLRRQQIKCILEALRTRVYDRTSAPDPVAGCLLCGDLNAAPDSLPIQYLQTSEGFAADDCYLAGRGELPGFTRLSRYAGQSRRIDYVFALSPPGKPAFRILSAATVLNQPDENGIMPSDHMGVLVRAAWMGTARM